ncbi:DUF6461 domain-containing protein [Streptomyces sp. B3I7]|uniref:DUF6461 domain-containing protein n=1 Tax=Streptomyces sp. B3I7 TaxID=3042269 RepID=UPI00358F8FDF
MGTWSFCYESPGVNGTMPWTLAALSQNTEVLSYHHGAKGLNIVERWIDGQPVEQFEPSNERTLAPRVHRCCGRPCNICAAKRAPMLLQGRTRLWRCAPCTTTSEPL